MQYDVCPNEDLPRQVVRRFASGVMVMIPSYTDRFYSFECNAKGRSDMCIWTGDGEVSDGRRVGGRRSSRLLTDRTLAHPDVQLFFRLVQQAAKTTPCIVSLRNLKIGRFEGLFESG